MRDFLTALKFLTIIPIKSKTGKEDIDLARSMAYFPLVGGLIGLILFGVWEIGGTFLPSSVVCALILALYIIITGALHLDGFADTIDGISGGRDKADIIDIMQTSHIGAIGMVGIVALLLLKFTLIYSLPSTVIGQSLVLMMVMGRWSMVFSCQVYPAAGDRQSLARKFIEHIELKQLLWATVTMVILLAVLAGLKALVIFPIILIVSILFNNFLVKKIGGLTGDTLGALNEFVELATLLIFTIAS